MYKKKSIPRKDASNAIETLDSFFEYCDVDASIFDKISEIEYIFKFVKRIPTQKKVTDFFK